VPSLERIELHHCARATDAGLPFLAALPNLQDLIPGGLPGVTRDGVANIPVRPENKTDETSETSPDGHPGDESASDETSDETARTPAAPRKPAGFGGFVGFVVSSDGCNGENEP
jgi:hypothetical protein